MMRRRGHRLRGFGSFRGKISVLRRLGRGNEPEIEMEVRGCFRFHWTA